MAEHWHRRLIEGKSGLMAALTTVLISVGGLVEIVPMFTLDSVPEADWIDPYTPLEVAGRDIYIREGCYTCHSQMVRPFRDETLRYGPWSHSSEYMWDRPFLLGSRRIGPDLHRIGGDSGGQRPPFQMARAIARPLPTLKKPTPMYRRGDKYDGIE